MVCSTYKLMQKSETIIVNNEIESVDFIVIIRGSLILEYDLNDPICPDVQKTKILKPQGYIYPAKSHEYEYLREIKVYGDEPCELMVISKVNFKKIIGSVSAIFIYKN